MDPAEPTVTLTLDWLLEFAMARDAVPFTCAEVRRAFNREHGSRLSSTPFNRLLYRSGCFRSIRSTEDELPTFTLADDPSQDSLQSSN